MRIRRGNVLPLSALVGAAVIASGVFFWTTQIDTKAPENNINKSNATTTTNKKYTNTKYNYSFNYDKQYIVTTCSDSQAVIIDTSAVVCDVEHSRGILIAAQSAGYSESNTISQMKKLITNPVQTTIKVDGVTATRLYGNLVDDIPNAGKWTDMVFVTKLEKSFIFTNVQNKNSITQIDDLVKSFKFIK